MAVLRGYAKRYLARRISLSSTRHTWLVDHKVKVKIKTETYQFRVEFDKRMHHPPVLKPRLRIS
jgi:hypothetical protein